MKISSISRVIIPYFIVASAWILFSDYFTFHYEKEMGLSAGQVQTLKGLAFVFCTSLLLFWLVKKHSEKLESTQLTLFESEAHYRTAFEKSPASLLLEDFSRLRSYIEKLKKEGVTDLGPYLKENPEIVDQCISMVRILNANEAAVNLYDAKNEKELMKSTQAILYSNITSELIREITAVAKAEQVFEKQITIETLAGKVRHLIIRWTVVSGHEEAMDRVLVTVVDVTEHRSAELKLQESEEKYRTLVENSSQGIMVIQDGILVFVNPFVSRILMYPRERLVGISYRDFVHPQDLANADYRLQSALTERQISQSYEVRLLRRDGEVFWFQSNGVPIKWMGQPAYMTFLNDITKRKDTEQKLQESKARYRSIAEDMPLMLCRFRPDYTITYINDIYSRAFGKKREELIGLSFLLLVAENERETVKKELALLTENDPTRVIESRVITEDQEIRWQRWTNRALFDRDGNVTAYQAIGEDITKQKKLEKEKEEFEIQVLTAQKMEAIGTLAGGIAHDFNNLLSAILGFSQLAKQEISEESPAMHDIETVISAGERASALVKQILLFSRKETEDRHPFYFHLIVKEALKMLRSSIPSYIEIIHEIKAGSYLNMDPGQAHQIVMNLCTNAYQAIEDTNGIIKVGLKEVWMDKAIADRYPALDQGNYLNLSVTDNGPGIEPELVDRIFEPYFTTKELHRGTGLGLSVVHGIVKRAGGDVFVESTPGKGTRFDVFLPIWKGDSACNEDYEKTELTGNGERLMVVEDEDVLLELICMNLEDAKYNITAFSQPEKALASFRDAPGEFDAVVTDLSMPKMPGWDLIKFIKEIRPDIPVVICTGLNDQPNKTAGGDKLYTQTVLKPFKKNDLLKAVHSALINQKNKA